MRAVIYARYSSEQQREASIEDQIRNGRAEIERQGWTYLTAYMDAAISGASSLRPGYQALLEEARGGKFDVIVAEGLDRLSRDQADIATLYKVLSFAGIRLFTLAEGEISELHVGLKGTMNALFLKDLALKTHRGLEGRVRAGRSAGGLCYGYRPVPGDPGALQIDEAEAAIVRRIFQQYAEGMSPKAIAAALNAEGVPGPRASTWGQSTINGNRQRATGVLSNELYIGIRLWNRLRYLKDPVTGKRVSRLNPEEQWVREPVPELRIVKDELWAAVQGRYRSMVAARKSYADQPGFWDRRRPRYLLSGLVRCGACGGGFSIINATSLGCSTARNKGVCDNRLTIRRYALEFLVLYALRTQLMAPDAVAAFAETYVAEINRLRAAGNAEHARLEVRRAEIDRQLDRLMQLVLEEEQPQRFIVKMKDLEAEIADIDKRLAAAPPSPVPLIHPSLAEVYRRKVAELQSLLQSEPNAAGAKEQIRSLIESVTLHPVEGELQVELRGELAAMLQLCADSKKPLAEVRQGLMQVKLVAGRGFEPLTFRL